MSHVSEMLKEKAKGQMTKERKKFMTLKTIVDME
jgi:hypothetical protein